MLKDVADPSAQRIGIFIEHLGSGGAEKVAVVLANGLAEKGFVVDLLMWDGGGPNLKDVSPQVAKFDFSAERPIGVVRVVRLFMQYLRQKKPIVVFAHLEKSSLLAIIGGLLCGYRRIVPCIHIDLEAYASINHRLRRRLLNCLVATFYHLAPQVIAVSEGVGRSARRLLSPFGPPVRVVYNGFDFAALRSKSQQPVKEAWLQNKTTPVVISCGRLQQQKAFEVLLRAFADLRQMTPVRLIILGEGPEHEALLSLARTLGVAEDVSLPGFVDNPIAWFAKSDLFVLPSRCEGHPLVLIEALVAGIPIISTDCSSGPNEILENGRFGTLVPVENAAALTEAMLQALKQLPVINKTEVARHLQKYSVEKMIAGYHMAGMVFGTSSGSEG